MSLSLLILACFGVAAALAQNVSHAICSNPAFSWAFNSLKQSPCEIGEALGTQCDGDFLIPPLPVNSSYSGFLNQAAATSCGCNTVYYTLLAACAACQGGGIFPFPEWSDKCATQYSTFPGEIPAGVAVPYYAYLPLVNGSVDGDAAMHAEGPEATGNSQPTSSGAFTLPTSTPSASAVSSGGGGSGDAGAIAGAVVGGLALISAGAIVVFYLLKRKRKMRLSKESEPMMDVGPWTDSDPPPLFTGSSYPPFMGSTRVYDPNDPATYPLAGPGSSVYHDEQQNEGSQWNPPAYQPHVASPPPPTTYQGAPEF